MNTRSNVIMIAESSSQFENIMLIMIAKSVQKYLLATIVSKSKENLMVPNPMH